jgi:hypothetical protein
VGYCDPTSDSLLYTARTWIAKGSLTPDTAALAMNWSEICAGGTAHDPTGKIAKATCTGTLMASVDGVVIDFSTRLDCAYKNDGLQAQYVVTGTDATGTKTLHVRLNQTGGVVIIPNTQLFPGAISYKEGDVSVAFPKDVAGPFATVTTFAAAGAGLQAQFVLGQLNERQDRSGIFRTIELGSIDIKLTP